MYFYVASVVGMVKGFLQQISSFSVDISPLLSNSMLVLILTNTKSIDVHNTTGNYVVNKLPR